MAVVTGASRGLGRAVAVALAGAGFDVVATMRDPDAAGSLDDEADGPGRISVDRLDVTRPETISLPEGLSVLVNNAGVELDYLPLEATPMEHWRTVFETNVFGTVEVIRRAVPLMRAAGGGVICNVTSASVLVSVPFYSVYRASKAAVSALGESLRAEVAPFGIRVVEVAPGPIATDMLAGSARIPEAAGCPGYEALAGAMHEGRSGIDAWITSPQEAARRVVEVVTGPDAALRQPCDPLGADLLDAWRADPEASLGGR